MDVALTVETASIVRAVLNALGKDCPTLAADVTADVITVDNTVTKVAAGRYPTAMPWKDTDVALTVETADIFRVVLNALGKDTDEALTVDTVDIFKVVLNALGKDTDVELTVETADIFKVVLHAIGKDCPALVADVTAETITVDSTVTKVAAGRYPTAMPWKDTDVELNIGSTNMFNSLECGAVKVVSLHLAGTAQQLL
jgi:glyceraldehyde-3-phosphate dehydrogenase/erythrose-4-phosphate dehydrogenase